MFVLHLFVTFTSLVRSVERRARTSLLADQRGQATAEYALVLLGAAAIALLLAAWAAKSGAISRLFDTVVDRLVDDVG
ncbi:MAG: DUF4244 domain-containing protein [Acidimicrobiales bacterium]|nr:DUF4244 domain-containing protein [Acidimicrobiales bacterium]